MSAIIDTKRAAERLLLSLTPSIPTALESVDFEPPVNAMYQRVQFMLNPPDDPVFTAGYHRENIQMQVFVADTKGHGTVQVNTRAELIRSAFYKGRTFIEGSTRIHILRTPQMQSAFAVQDRIVVPVLINLVAEVGG